MAESATSLSRQAQGAGAARRRRCRSRAGHWDSEHKVGARLPPAPEQQRPVPEQRRPEQRRPVPVQAQRPRMAQRVTGLPLLVGSRVVLVQVPASVLAQARVPVQVRVPVPVQDRLGSPRPRELGQRRRAPPSTLPCRQGSPKVSDVPGEACAPFAKDRPETGLGRASPRASCCRIEIAVLAWRLQNDVLRSARFRRCGRHRG